MRPIYTMQPQGDRLHFLVELLLDGAFIILVGFLAIKDIITKSS